MEVLVPHYWRKIPITLIDPDRPVLNECNRLVSTIEGTLNPYGFLFGTQGFLL